MSSSLKNKCFPIYAISELCCSCVRLLVHRFIFSMLLGKYSRNICYLYMLSMKLFFQILFVWKENDLVFSSEFEKIALRKIKT